ncbi:hypothetical protein AJ80_09047 [Polytolypa hystricis UAMH7299]|uniref:Nudix hydrolase domain-containing protein n=1 Tax=Polytolypa hystricis (strain UAMH7299) TaxID=1447883 RepID=A0A2B7WXD7_POLH7|nr:hypothetical protein AJ80_09047 [Polytolypa hystricis UAMH7299]
MRSRLCLVKRQIQLPRKITTATKNMSSFTIPNSNPPVSVRLSPDLSQSQLLSFPAFKIWLSTLQHSLSRQQDPSHEFYATPYVLREIDVQSVDFFGGSRLGFVKLKADVSADHSEKLPGSVFLRGGSVGMLLILQPDDVPEGSEDDKRVILTVQPRIPAGSLAFPELPAGMLDDEGTFAGGAAKEIQEETGLSVPQDELIDLTALTVQSLQKRQTSAPADPEQLQKAVYPSPGGSDEFIPLFLCQKRMNRREIDEMQGRLTGLRKEGEKITLKIVPLEELWREGMRDGKALAAWALYQGLKQEGII